MCVTMRNLMRHAHDSRSRPDLPQDARRRALERGTTLSAVVSDALRADLLRRSTDASRRPFARVIFDGKGGTQPGVDINDNRTLATLLDGDAWTS